MAEEDENLKKASQSADYVMLQQRVEDYKAKLISLQNKIYAGKYQGINLKMKGNYTVIEDSIDQTYYETASRSQIEHALLICYTNLHQAIEAEQKEVTDQMQAEIARYQASAVSGN